MAYLLREQLERIAPLLSDPEYLLMAKEGDELVVDDPKLAGRRQCELFYGIDSDALEQSDECDEIDPKLLATYQRTIRRMLKDCKTIGLIYKQLISMGCDEDLCSTLVLHTMEHNNTEVTK